MKTKKERPLPPKKLSDIIVMALIDLEITENDSNYEVDMEAWHRQIHKPSNLCSVCFAGAVIAQTLKKPINYDFELSDWEPKWKSVFFALNCIRTYDLHGALVDFHGHYYDEIEAAKEVNQLIDDIYELEYEDDPEQFKINMNNYVDKLRYLGL